MAAFDNFDAFNSSLTKRDYDVLESLIKTTRQELLAMRSEEARARTVSDYMEKAREWILEGGNALRRSAP